MVIIYKGPSVNKTLLVDPFYEEHSRTSPQRPPWTQTRVAAGETWPLRGRNIVLKREMPVLTYKYITFSKHIKKKDTKQQLPIQLAVSTRFNGHCRCGEVAVPDPPYCLVFLRPGKIGLLYA